MKEKQYEVRARLANKCVLLRAMYIAYQYRPLTCVHTARATAESFPTRYHVRSIIGDGKEYRREYVMWQPCGNTGLTRLGTNGFSSVPLIAKRSCSQQQLLNFPVLGHMVLHKAKKRDTTTGPYVPCHPRLDVVVP